MATSRNICSIEGCKRAVACLCRHCHQDVCSKHFNEHQIEVNNQLIPITNRLNELKMRLKIDDDQIEPIVMLKTWREEKYKEIDKEYDVKLEQITRRISALDEKITQTMNTIRELESEGDISIEQVQQIQTTIEQLTNKINQLFNNNSDLVGKHIQLGNIGYLVKAKVKCRNTDLYALESEKPLVGYDGVCPKCRELHVDFAPKRGLYARAKSIHQKLDQ